IISRVNTLFEEKQYQLALQVLDILIQSEPQDVDALRLRVNIVNKLAENDSCVMSKNAYFYSVRKDKEAIHQMQRLSD
ncbi:MAG: alkyl sulfatase dimerization domain-containing protein, partial [Promethearchaeota archaeon]